TRDTEAASRVRPRCSWLAECTMDFGNIVAQLVSVNVGLPRDLEWKGRTVHTGIWKDPVAGRCRVGRLNLDGDGQGDLAGHGGEQRAVFVYQLESYRHWQEHLKRTDFVHGQFGENFTVEGLPDDVVCIGDRYRIGDALFEVSQPRVTCTRRSFGWSSSGISPTSSRKSVPPWATSKRPIFCAMAPVNAPRS